MAVLYTSPETVIEDYARLMRLADYEQSLDKTAETLLKINVSWQHWYPACSTEPWQLDAVIKTLREDGFDRLRGAHNGTVVVDAHEGEVNNKHKSVTDKNGVPVVHLSDDDTEWTIYEPKGHMAVLNEIYPNGIKIPKILVGKNVVHLPTVKTHVFTTITGAMKNAFGGLLHFDRHWTHSVIHKTLGDLLTIQKEIHPGLFAVMDGTFAGDGPGPRAMRPHIKNIILASSDMVAIDAISAKIQGFDPMSLEFIASAHERGLGTGDPREIEVVGADISEINWHFRANEETLASRGQKMIYWGPLKPLENILLRSPIAPWSFFASNAYFNHYWYRFVGKKRVRQALGTEWGRLFQSY